MKNWIRELVGFYALKKEMKNLIVNHSVKHNEKLTSKIGEQEHLIKSLKGTIKRQAKEIEKLKANKCT